MRALTLSVAARQAPGMDFQEYTPFGLAAALTRAGDGMDVVELQVEALDGRVLHSGVMRFHVGHGSDFDPAGTYTWVRITAQLEA